MGISTNGFVKKNGCAVMGRGCAHQATLRFPNVAHNLGSYICMEGNRPGYIFLEGATNPSTDRLMILPVKHNWWEGADRDLIIASRDFLMQEAIHNRDWTFHVPRLGCGNGRLNWVNDVRPLMDILPNNVVVHS